MANGFFITGTDTEVGKTFVTALLLRELNRNGRAALGMKPVASGCHIGADGLTNEDVEALLSAGHHQVPHRLLNPYAFEPPISPHIAALRAGVVVSFQELKTAYDTLTEQADTVLVEGAGGWLAPISDVVDMADLAAFLSLPVIMVVGMRLGCLNHAVLTARAIQASGCQLLGWVANRVVPDMLEFDANLVTLERRISAPLLGLVPHAPAGTIPILGRANLEPLLS
ncbi:dethiobiotin synthase [Chitinivorax sp. B]|uniref:dethiobiotin synthase n=1 Tax=Chitinivorax sp. B TaxID=2502235 RepID=UPI0010F71B50|nr:dethiobiotin synthase [Chitinivorax sp. B]